MMKTLDRIWLAWRCFKNGHKWVTIWGTNFAECDRCKRKQRV